MIYSWTYNVHLDEMSILMIYLLLFIIQVIYMHGGEVIDNYNSHDCTHLLAQNKESEVFTQVSTIHNSH